MSGGTTISTSETRIEALQLQSSAYGVTVTLAYGLSAFAGNLVWYGGFKATPHTETQGSGGKGGGVKTQSTSYSYSASVMMGLCHGKINGIPRVWKGKQLFAGGITPTQLLTVVENYTVPGGGGTYAAAHAAAFSALVGVANLNPGEYGPWTLAEGTDFTISGGAFTFPAGLGGMQVAIEYQYTVAGVTQTALQQLGLSFIAGTIGQAAWAPLTTLAPSQAIGYSGMALVAGQDYPLGTGAQVDNHVFEVQAPMAYSVSGTVPDADPADFVPDVLMNARYGASFPAARLGDTTAWNNYNRATGLLCSPAITEQVTAAELVTMATRITNTGPVWSGGRLKFIPYGDQAASGNGRTYTPNTTPIYDLSDAQFLDKDVPVDIQSKAPSERYNHIRIEYRNRGAWDATNNVFLGQYSTEIAEAKDQADIDANGLRSADIEQLHWICDGGVARNVAQLLLQRSLYIPNNYVFRLPWTYDGLDGMDLVTLTDPDQGLNLTPVRIIDIEEDEQGTLIFTAEDFPLGVASATLYPSQLGTGFAHDYNVSPGSVDTPVFFEAPASLTVTGLEIYAAVKGSGAYWAGCRVWVSLDGTTYKQIATVQGAARYGHLTGAISGGNLPVSTSGQLLSGSAADAAALNTLCWIGGATTEFLAYQTATLTGAGAYTLSGLVRGAYGTSQASAHATNDAFVRVDDAIAKSGPLDLSMIGKVIHFKFTSFNVYGSAEESLATVTDYTYTITGAMAQLPPLPPTSFVATNEPFGVRLSCVKSPDPDVVGYQYRVGATWAGATLLEPAGGTSYLWQVQAIGSFTVWVAAIDVFGNFSTPVSATAAVTGPTVNSLTASIHGADLQLDYAATPGAFAIAGYEIRFGNVYASATVVGVYQITRHVRHIDWGGPERWWVTAIDVKGSYGTPVSVDVVVTVPGAVTATRADVVDNNALLYWSAPATGSLPIDRYEVRKGASWAAGTVVGSNGNSTFTAIFEQQSGLYTYWIAAYDSAGNIGTPVGIAATINQPPDYVLRTNIDSTFSGTLTNMYLEAGAMLGPRDTSETWATHFSGHSWSTIGDQITAGYALYAEPSTTSGSYEEIFDYGATLPATTIQATLGYTVLAGTVTVSCQIYTKLNIGDSWTAAASGQTTVLVSNFRYVRVVWSFACTAGANLISVSSFNLKLSSKQKSDGGSFTISNATTGVAVSFNVPFISAFTPIAQPDGLTPLVPVVDFAGGINPTGFTVYLYNQSGTKVTGSGSWNVKGF